MKCSINGNNIAYFLCDVGKRAWDYLQKICLDHDDIHTDVQEYVCEFVNGG